MSAALLCACGFAAPQETAACPEQLLARIQQDFQRQDLSSARRQIEQALKTYPNDSRLYNFLGVLEAQLLSLA